MGDLEISEIRICYISPGGSGSLECRFILKVIGVFKEVNLYNNASDDKKNLRYVSKTVQKNKIKKIYWSEILFWIVTVLFTWVIVYWHESNNHLFFTSHTFQMDYIIFHKQGSDNDWFQCLRQDWNIIQKLSWLRPRAI